MKIALSVSEKEKAKGSESPYFKALKEAGAQPEELELVTASSEIRADHFDAENRVRRRRLGIVVAGNSSGQSLLD